LFEWQIPKGGLALFAGGFHDFKSSCFLNIDHTYTWM